MPYLPDGKPTNWKTIIPEKFSHCCEGSEPHVVLASLQRNWESPGNLTLRISGSWLQDFHRTGGETLLAGDKQNLACTKTQGKGAVTPQETEPDLPPKVGVAYGSEVQKRLALGTRVLAAAILEGGPWRLVSLEVAENQALHSWIMFLTSVVWEEVKLASEPFVGFCSFSSKTEAPGGDIASKYGQGILRKGELGCNLGQPRTGDRNHTLHSPRSFLPASACVWLSALMCDLYSFPIIVFMLDQVFSTNSSFSKSFHRNAFRSMKPRNWNSLQHTAKKSPHTESTLKLAPKMKRKYLCQHLSMLPSRRCLRAAVLSPPWGQPLRASWWFLPGARNASCVIWTHWIQTAIVWKPLLLSPY